MIRALLNIQRHFQAFVELVDLVKNHRQLIIEMARREIFDRYLGQVCGAFWAIVHPLILIVLYVFVFGFIFKMKIGGTMEMPFDYTTYLLSGLIPWMGFQESMSKSSMVIVNNANLVKQVVFPIEVLPVKGVIASLMTMSVSFLILILYVIVSQGFLVWTYMLLPFLVTVQMFAMIGLSYILSSIGVYFRDTKDFVQVFIVVSLYLMPVFYLPEQVPIIFKPILYLNPFSYAVWCYQDALYYGHFEHKWAWLAFIVLSTGFFYFGYRVFRKLKVMFGNVL